MQILVALIDLIFLNQLSFQLFFFTFKYEHSVETE